MTSVNYTIRLDEADKQAAEKVFSQLGLSLAAGLNVYLKAVVRQQRIPFELALDTDGKMAIGPVGVTKTRKGKEKSFYALRGVLAGHDIDLEKEREERIRV